MAGVPGPGGGVKLVEGLRLAVGLLTVMPVRPPAEVGRPQARGAMLLAPLAVLPVALASALIGWAGVVAGLPSALAGVLVVAALAYGTRAMHLDGLADTVDGLGSGKDADAALAIMKRGDLGPMGAIALVLALLVQALAAGAVLSRPFGWLAVAVLLAGSRAALVVGCAAGVPAARPGGLGALVAGSVPVAGGAAVGLLCLGALQAAGLLVGWSWWLPAAVVAAAGLVSILLVRRCVRRFGGITGDVLGALVEVSACVLLLGGALR